MMMRLLVLCAALLWASSAHALTPDQVSGLKLWLKADAGCLNGSSSACVNTDAWATWNDQSVSGCNATQATGANRPVYATNTLNGLPTMTLSGTQYLFGTATCVGEPGTIFIVSQPIVRGTCSFGMDSSDAGVDGALFMCSPWSISPEPTTYTRILGGPVNWQGSSQGEVGPWQVLAATNDGSNINFYKGTVLAQTTAKPAGTARTIAGNYGVGTAFNSAAFPHAVVAPFKGSIGEIVVFSGVLSSSDRQGITAYLEAKWGLAPTCSPYTYVAASNTPPVIGSLSTTQLMLWQSCDAVTWQRYDSSYIPPSGHTTRDPVIFHWSTAGQWVGLFGNGAGNYGRNTHTFDVATAVAGPASSRPDKFTYQCSIDVSSVTGSGTSATVFEPRPFHTATGDIYLDGSGLFHIILIWSNDDQSTLHYSEMHPTTSDPCGTWSAPAAFTYTFTPNVSLFDTYSFFDGSTYYVWYVAGSGGSGNCAIPPESIQVMSASSITGPYTNITSGDWAGWQAGIPCTNSENNLENITVIRKPDRTWMAMFYNGLSLAGNPTKAYRSTNSNTAAYNPANGSWTTPTRITTTQYSNIEGDPGSLEPHFLSSVASVPFTRVTR